MAPSTRASEMENLAAEIDSGYGPDGMSDVQLLLGLRSRDPDSLARLYDRFGRIVFSLATRLLNDTRESEEVTQDVFLTLWNDQTRYQQNLSSPLTWLTSITRYKCIDKLRKSGRRIPCAGESSIPKGATDSGSNSDPFAKAALDDLSRQIRDCLGRLPASQRIAIEYSYFDCLTVSEIAERLSVPKETVRSRIRLAINKLKVSINLCEGRPFTHVN